MGVSVLAHDAVRTRAVPEWARWKESVEPYTVGLEEEVMLLKPGDLSFAQGSDRVIDRLSPRLTPHTSRETHAGILELKTGAHHDARSAVAELWALRLQLAIELEMMDLRVAAAGMHPLASSETTTLSDSHRYRLIGQTMRWLALREPTMALHVHVAVPDPGQAIRVQRRARENLPLLLSLSANSPFAHGRDTGFASTRTVVLDGFPRTGAPRAFASYGDYVAAVDALIASSAIPEPTFLWWDVRLQPRLGTVEVRVMDTQSTVAEVMALVALLQSLVRLEVEESPPYEPASDEVLAENRFLAARDGLDAQLIEPASRRLTPARALLSQLLEQCRPHAFALGRSREFATLERQAEMNGATRQRRWVAERRDLTWVLRAQTQQFTEPLDGN